MSNLKLQILKNTSILVVEDDELTRIAISGGLKRYCEAFYMAKDGLEGLEKFKEQRVDIIVTDIHMPNLNGLDMMNEILKLKPSQNFIVITSYDTDENLFESIKKGAISFIKKPILMENLQNSIVMTAVKNEEKILKLSPNVVLNLSKEKIFLNGKEIYLSRLENAIFWLLCYNISSLVSYEMIEDYAYGGKSIKSGTIHTAIARIKKQLDDIEILNLSCLGYMLKTS
ncbi:response regulator [Campylobacter geochelonis]|uniref:Putative two-component regulator n=1 Tax=Campylobacter geochelonis TaxID=1780362 RepID=A0A128EF68_9BACT|nr:response regulator [Campylobacter geochelonis]QKF71768.1 two-component system response regulator [Campylobacter geochelonis]CZE47555.1 putative two-component regulator [Campylobacter geochelonis]